MTLYVIKCYIDMYLWLQSKLCHLRGADPQKLVAHKEEATEMGG